MLALCVARGVRAQDQDAARPVATPAVPTGIHIKFDAADSPGEVSQSIKIMLLLTVLSLAPSAIIMTTSFTRILIVLGFLRRALGTQQTPPGQVLAAMALFLTIFTMAPVWQKINAEAIQPYMAEELTEGEAWQKGMAPLRKFMARQTGENELDLFLNISNTPRPATLEELPTHVLIPAFMSSELKTALQMAFLIYLPFLLLDLIIASSLMSLGMMMLPPMMISLPIKVLLFVLADGWNVLIRGVVTSFSL
ncbi:MAG: flagellar type III secretion system pore protein FliP [Kiritimatiellae bacterium]|nr:flagellar type III secretion system pore protein FliP [Kiritimatiellia bacterium]